MPGPCLFWRLPKLLLMLHLTPDQKGAKTTILKAIEPPFGVALLTGYAGTGKTTLVSDLVSTIAQSGLKVTIACPTHKAAAVVRQMLPGEGVLEVGTIHAIFGMRILKTPDGKSKCSPPSKRVRDALIIDEASMINQDIFDVIMKNSERIIFVGDPAQLPPVEGNNLSPVFGNIVERAHLSQVIRQAEGNPIIELATWLRDKIERSELLTISDLIEKATQIDPDQTKIGIDSKFNIPQIVKSAIDAGMDARMLGFTNACTAKMAQLIKRQLKPSGVVWPFEKGDPVYFASPLIDQESGKVLIDNNSETTVIESHEPVFDPVTDLGIQNINLVQFGWVMAPCDVQKYRQKIKKVQADYTALEINQKFGLDRRELKKNNRIVSTRLTKYADLRINHTMTIHKSQGSTFDCVILDLKDIFTMREHLLRALYVAVTRPIQYLVFCS